MSDHRTDAAVSPGSAEAPDPSAAPRAAAAAEGPGAPAADPAATKAPESPEELVRQVAAIPTAVRQGIEAILFLADEPVDVANLAELLELAPEVVEALLVALSERDEAEERGTRIRAVAGGWRMYTSPAAKPLLQRWALAGRTGRLTQAALETLAVVAYKQPISRQEISDIRGVSADGAVRSLVARGLVTEVGRDPGPGQAVLYGTTTTFLERVGLDSVHDLPDLTQYLPEAPAPDEPELGALKEVRRRLAAGGDLPTGGLGGRSAAQTNTGAGEDTEGDADGDDDVLPPPGRPAGQGRDDEAMDALTDRLEVAARNAVTRLRAAVAAGDAPQDPADDDAAQDPSDRDAPRDPADDDAAQDPSDRDAPRDPADDDAAPTAPHADATDVAPPDDAEVSRG